MRIRHYFTSLASTEVGPVDEVTDKKPKTKETKETKEARETKEKTCQTSPKKPVRSLGRRTSSQTSSEQVPGSLACQTLNIF